MRMTIADNCVLLGVVTGQDNSFSEDKPLPGIDELHIVLCRGALFSLILELYGVDYYWHQLHWKDIIV